MCTRAVSWSRLRHANPTVYKRGQLVKSQPYRVQEWSVSQGYQPYRIQEQLVGEGT